MGNTDKQTITATASPRPWRVTEYEAGPQDICDADGFRVCTMGITTSSDADAALIAEAVNERDRLRDIVRRMIKVVQNTLDFAEAMNGIIEATPERIKAQDDVRALLREARAAIGEDRT